MRRFLAADDDLVADLDPNVRLQLPVGLSRAVAKDRRDILAPQHPLRGDALVDADAPPRCRIARALDGSNDPPHKTIVMLVKGARRQRAERNGF